MSQDTITITVTDEAIDWIRGQVRSGHFASEDEAIQAGIFLLRDEAEFERTMCVVAEPYDEAGDGQEREPRLQQFGKAAYESYQANPTAVYTFEEVQDHLAIRRRERAAQTG